MVVSYLSDCFGDGGAGALAGGLEGIGGWGGGGTTLPAPGLKFSQSPTDGPDLSGLPFPCSKIAFSFSMYYLFLPEPPEGFGDTGAEGGTFPYVLSGVTIRGGTGTEGATLPSAAHFRFLLLVMVFVLSMTSVKVMKPR